MPNINQDGNALSIGSAATAIQEVLDLGNQTTNPTDAQDESETPEEELEAQEDDEDAQPEMEADAEDEGEEGSDEGDELADEDEADSSDEEETYFTVQVDGEEMEVSQSELIAGYQKDADYRRKTQQLAEDKKAFEAEVENVSSKEQGLRQEYLNRLQQAEQIIVDLGGLQEPNWEELQAQDPVNFAWHQKQWQDKLGGLQRIRAERIALEQAQQKEQASNMQSFAVGELQKLQDTIPGWNDKSVAKAEMDEIAQHAQEVLDLPKKNFRECQTVEHLSDYEIPTSTQN